MLHFREFLEEARLHGPIFEVVSILQKDLGHLVAVGRRIVGKDIPIRVRPVEIEIFNECGRKRTGRSILFVLKHKAISKTRPITAKVRTRNSSSS